MASNERGDSDIVTVLSNQGGAIWTRTAKRRNLFVLKTEEAAALFVFFTRH
jgi:hypothetical protein